MHAEAILGRKDEEQTAASSKVVSEPCLKPFEQSPLWYNPEKHNLPTGK
jgi:hypothetical protein